MAPLEQLIQSIDARIADLKSEIDSLQAARSALVSNGAAPAARAARASRSVPRSARRSAPKARPTRRRRQSKTRTQLTAEAAEQLLATSDGLTTAALAERAGADRDQVLALLRDLEQSRRVRRSGQRRATRWHTITDEDRIRERAAELASRSRSRGNGA